jgi:predicted dehydrogenase
MVGFNYRRIPSVSLAKKMIEAGKLGTIYQMQCNFFEDWGAPPYPLTWRFKAQTAGAGALADLGSHAIDLTRYLIGEPSRVCALRETFIKQRTDPSSSRRGKVDVDDTTLCLLRYSGGAIATIGASWIAQGRKVALDFQINGSKGTLCFSLERPNELLYYSSEDSANEQGFKTLYAGPSHPYGAALIFPIADYGMGYADSMVNEVYDLVNAIREGEPIAPTFFDGWKTSQVIDAVLKSSEKDGWVTMA